MEYQVLAGEAVLGSSGTFWLTMLIIAIIVALFRQFVIRTRTPRK